MFFLASCVSNADLVEDTAEVKTVYDSWHSVVYKLGELKNEKGKTVVVMHAFPAINDLDDFIQNIEENCSKYGLYKGNKYFVLSNEFVFRKEPYRTLLANYDPLDTIKDMKHRFDYQTIERDLVGWFDSERRVLFFRGRKVNSIEIGKIGGLCGI